MSEVAQTAEKSPEITPSKEKKEGLFSRMFGGISTITKGIRESLGKALNWGKTMLEKGIEQLFPELKEMKEAVTKSETKPPPDTTEKSAEDAETNTEEEDQKPADKETETKPSQGESTKDKDNNNNESESPKKGKGTEAKSPKKENPKGAETTTKATNPKKKAA